MVDVSIIIPCYNASEYIEDCVQSAARQTGVHVEILAVEDRSTDDTWDKLQSLARTIPDLRCERLDRNSGQATARNHGIERARGRYVAFLDADDMYHSEDVLRRWISRADDRHLDICIADFEVLSGDKVIRPEKRLSAITAEAGSALDSPQIVNTAQCWQILYNTEFLQRENLRFSTRLRQREDRLFFIEAFVCAERIGTVDFPAILYRDHPDSTMKRVDYSQLAQFNIHMETMSSVLARARSDGRVSEDFERANAVAYWRQAMQYWTPLLLPAIAPDKHGGNALSTKDIACAENFLAKLHELTRACEPLFLDQHYVGHRGTVARKAEATFDIARMALAAGRKDVFAQMLEADRRVHHTVLTELIDACGFDWAEAAALQYLKYSRCAEYEQERITSETPALSSLVRRVVLHIGMPKTGSSAVQEYLETNRFKLLEKGLHYPIFGTFREHGIRRNRSSGHYAALRRILEDPEGSQVAERLAAEIATLPHPVDTLVLSSENLLSHVFPVPESTEPSLPIVQMVNQIVDTLGVGQVEIVATFRRQDDWFRSYYREVLANPMNGFVLTPRQFFALLDERDLFDHEAILSGLRESDRVASVHADSFGQLRREGGSIPAFLKCLGTSAKGLLPETRTPINTSFSDTAAANIRLLKLHQLAVPETEALFTRIISAPELEHHDFSLITNADWDDFDKRLEPFLTAFDTRFPKETRPVRPISDDAPLIVLPALQRAGANHFSARRRAEVARIEADYRYMIESRSWKLTAPLRKILTAIKRLRARILPAQDDQDKVT